jgi:serine/threonine protein phosphatase 1
VIEKLIALSASPQHVFLRGNHDLWMLNAKHDREWFSSWLSVGGTETLDSYNACALSNVPQEHFNWLEETRYFFQTESHIFAHGAISQKPPHENREDWLLWRRIYDITPHPSGRRVICGHTAQKDGRPLDIGHAVCIDTFCYGGQWLTALDVDSNQLFQANESSQTRCGALEEFGKRPDGPLLANER